MKNNAWKWLILIALVSWSLVTVTPPKEKIKLGLDLQGGYSFILEVDDSDLTDVQKETAQEQALEVIRNRINISGTKEPIIYPEPGGNRIVVQLPGVGAEDRDKILELLTKQAKLTFRMVHKDNDVLVNKVFEQGLSPAGYELVSVPRNDRQIPMYRKLKKDGSAGLDNRAEQEALKKFQRPSPTYEFLLNMQMLNGQEFYEPMFVSKREEVTGDNLQSSRVEYDQFNQPLVSISFDSVGAEKFRITTGSYSPGGSKNPSQREEDKRRMAIVMDDTVYSAPTLNTAINNGSAVIEGIDSAQEAQLLTVVMRAGSLPARIELLTERLVQPTLGKDSVQSGVTAAMWGAVAVILFMFVYYRVAGIVVNLALILDAILLPLGMMFAAGFLGLFASAGTMGSGGNDLPTLTLPGIAGLVLTIGMAVDANVLIFERIREEQASGKRFVSAIQSGYEKVFSTIFDANITTLLVAVILFWQGSGPIRGFAVTLAAGIIVSMYTALVFTRMLFDMMARYSNIKEIKMLNLVKNANINFLGKRFIATILSCLIIFATWSQFIVNGSKNFGVDFTGGRAITYDISEQGVTEAEIREVLSTAGVSDPYVQFQEDVVNQKEFVEIKVDEESGVKTKEALDSLLNTNPSEFDRLMQDETVGPQVGGELQRKGAKAILFSLLGIVIYVSMRFEFSFAMGAIVALIHDVLITVGIYCIMGNQLTLPIVAALLTIVGYSVNDTIVVFDRIREDIALYKNRPLEELANKSINMTLGRTLMTSVTTLLTVLMLLIFGGGAIHDFALALTIGILVGTYSSVFVATPVMLVWQKRADAREANA